ncbi:MAG TPA: hypothetical protein VN541_23230 [Tepidisphaeraceae bacterium]|nr:hypothetical protein [Tepidisphaeraceae bacterium]
MLKLCLGIVAGLVVIVLGFTASRSMALQDNPQPSNYQDVVDNFWKTWENSRPSEAIQRAWPDQRDWDAIGRAADEFQSNATGQKCLGHAEITHKALSPTMQYLCFYAQYAPTPLRVEMLCYKATDQWQIIALHVDAAPARWLAEANYQQFGSGSDATAGQGQ